MKAADTLEDLGKLPGARCHELKADRKGQLAVDLVHPKRPVFVPGHNPLPSRSDGGLDWAQVTRLSSSEGPPFVCQGLRDSSLLARFRNFP